MSGILVICVSFLVTAGGASHTPASIPPLARDQSVENMWSGPAQDDNGTFLLEQWMDPPSSSPLTEFMIDTSRTYVPAVSWERDPSAAFDGTNYLVVWRSDRRGGNRIYGARMDTSGTILDPIGITICTERYSQEYPSVAFDGSNYLVVWQDHRADCNIYGARVDTSGTVLDTSGIAISTIATYWQKYPSVAFDGTNYLVVWQYGAGGQSIYGARMDTSGTVLDTTAIEISAAPGSQCVPAVAFDGANYLVVWHDSRSGSDSDIYGARVDPSGAVLDPSGIAICTAVSGQAVPSVAFDGTNYLVVWQDLRSGEKDIYGARVDTSGRVLDPLHIPICTAAGSKWNPSLAFNGADYLVLWEDWRSGGFFDSDIYGARVDTSGTVLDPSGLAITRAAYRQGAPSVTSDGTNNLVVWEDRWMGTGFDIHGTRVDTSATVLDSSDIVISTSADWQLYPSVAFDGTNYLAVWQDWLSDSGWDIRGGRVDTSATVLDPSGIAISDAANSQESPSVAFGGTDYFVVWQDLRSGSEWNIYGARVDAATGEVLDSSGIAVSAAADHQKSPSVAFDGTNYFVVWADLRDLGGAPDLYGARVDTSGTVLDPSGIAIADGNGPMAVSVAFDGTNYLAVWTRTNGDQDIYGARVDTSGTVLDPSGIVISSAVGNEGSPSVAFDGTNYLVVWVKVDPFGGYPDIWGARVDQSGAVLDPGGIWMTYTGNQGSPSVTFDGTNYAVVWHDDRSGLGWDIYGTSVDPSGTVLDPSGIELINKFYHRTYPAIERGSGNQSLLIYHGFTTEPYNSQRVFGAFHTAVGIEEDNEKINTHDAKLLQNEPNPFHSRTTIRYGIPASGYTSLKVYDSSGRLVRILVDEEKTAGRYEAIWDGADVSASRLPSGIYFYRLQSSGFTATRKMILLR